VRAAVTIRASGSSTTLPARHPAALNRAIAAARHPVIVRVDAQARIPDGYRDRVVELLVATGAVNVGGRQVATRRARAPPAAIAAAMNARLGHGGAAYRSGARAVRSTRSTSVGSARMRSRWSVATTSASRRTRTRSSTSGCDVPVGRCGSIRDSTSSTDHAPRCVRSPGSSVATDAGEP
jgi:hypothetical protein